MTGELAAGLVAVAASVLAAVAAAYVKLRDRIDTVLAQLQARIDEESERLG